MYLNSIIDQSPTRVFKVATALTGGQFTVVKLGENGVATAGANDVPVGVLTAETELPQAVGEDVNVQIVGSSMAYVGEAVKAGDLLAAGADGKLVKATSGKFIFARALENAAANVVAHIQILNAGYAA